MPSQENEWSCICLLGGTNFASFAILILEFGIASTVVFFVFHFIITGSHSNQWKNVMFISMGKEVVFRVVLSQHINTTMGHHLHITSDFNTTTIVCHIHWRIENIDCSTVE